MAMCSLILMSILKTGPGMVSEEEEAVFMAQCSAFASECALLALIAARLCCFVSRMVSSQEEEVALSVAVPRLRH